MIGRWTCDVSECGRQVEYDGTAHELFGVRRRDKERLWVIFTPSVLDKLYSFIITARSTCTAATRHLSSDLLSSSFKRRDVVKVGIAMLRTVVIPPASAICTVCGPNPDFIVIYGQALGCPDPDDANPAGLEEECPVLDIPASSLCVLPSAALRAAMKKVLKFAAPLTGPQEVLLRSWHDSIAIDDKQCVETAAASLFLRFFPQRNVPVGGGCGNLPLTSAGDSRGVTAPSVPPAPSGVPVGKDAPPTAGLEAKLRKDEDDNGTLGGESMPLKPTAEAWRDRVCPCAPVFELVPRREDGAWLYIRPFLQALVGERVSGMFHEHDESAVRLLANSMRLQAARKWRDVSDTVDGIGFLTNFIGWFADAVDGDAGFRMALGRVLQCAVDMEADVDKLFTAAAIREETVDRSYVDADNCRKWGGMPTPADYRN